MYEYERIYSQVLQARLEAGEIARWEYEPHTFRLAYRCTYTPDFRVTLPDGRVEWHEVKGGYIREDAWIKLKVAAAMFSDDRFTLAVYRRGRWTFKPVPSGREKKGA